MINPQEDTTYPEELTTKLTISCTLNTQSVSRSKNLPIWKVSIPEINFESYTADLATFLRDNVTHVEQLNHELVIADFEEYGKSNESKCAPERKRPLSILEQAWQWLRKQGNSNA